MHNFTATAMDGAGNVSTASNAVDPVLAPSAPTIASFSPDTGSVAGVTDANVLTLTGTATAGSIVNLFEGTILLGHRDPGRHRILVVLDRRTGRWHPQLYRDRHGVGRDERLFGRPQLSGTAEANSTVKVFDGGTQIGTALANSSGAWSFVTGALTSGAHTFTGTDTDGGGTSAASTAMHVTVDAPTLAVKFTGQVENFNGTVTLSGTGEAGSSIAIYDGSNSTPLGSATVSSSGTWSFTSAQVSNTVHNFTATAMDSAGNTGASTGVAVLGSKGNDTLSVPAGSNYDVLTGDGGVDTFVFAANFGQDTITDFVAKGWSHEVIQFSSSTFNSFSAVLAHAAQVGANVVIHDAVGDTLTLDKVKLSSLQSVDFHFAYPP